MSHEITLPSGATAVIREPDDLLYGEREDALTQLKSISLDGKLDLSAPGGALMVELQRAIIVLGVESWTEVDKATGELLPTPAVDPSALRKVSARDGAYLWDQTQPLLAELFPDFSVAPTGSPTTP